MIVQSLYSSRAFRHSRPGGDSINRHRTETSQTDKPEKPELRECDVYHAGAELRDGTAPCTLKMCGPCVAVLGMGEAESESQRQTGVVGRRQRCLCLCGKIEIEAAFARDCRGGCIREGGATGKEGWDRLRRDQGESRCLSAISSLLGR